MDQIDFKAVNQTALLNVDSFLGSLLPGGDSVGHEYVVRNPTRTDNSPGSFSINMKTGKWSDFAIGKSGNDLVSLYSYVMNVRMSEAACEIEKMYGVNPIPKQPSKSDKNHQVWSVIQPVPNDAPKPPKEYSKFGRYVASWPYRDDTSRVLGYACRFEKTDEHGKTDKVVLPLTYCHNGNGTRKWQWKSFAPPRSLYALDRLAEYSDLPVLVVEGEKCAEEAYRIIGDHFVATTNMGGSNAVDKTDWSPLKGREIIIWPDNDTAGEKALQSTIKQLKDISKTLKTVSPPENVSESWDIADAIEEGWTKDDILSFIQSAQSINSDDDHFWTVRKQKSGITIKISQSRLRSFLESRGFRKLYTSGSQQSMFVRIKDNIIEESSHERMKDTVLSYIQSLPDSLTDMEGNTILREDIMEAVERGAAAYFGRDKLEFLKAVDTSFHEDTADIAHLYYQNGVVKVTKDDNTFYQYSELTGLVWRNRIIDRDYQSVDITQGEFEKFLENVCGRNDDRRIAIETAIGYLLHRHKNRSLAKAVILVDEQISDTPEGRTGKSLIAEALGHMSSTAVIDGKSFRFDSQFAFQTIGLDTDIVVFDDVGAKFPFENMFHMITGGLSCEQKNKPRIKLSFEESPKYLITSNYVVPGEGGSADARKAEYELSPYYRKDFSPRDEFGHNLFDDWTADQWSFFDQHMIHCLQAYLIYGLKESSPINLGRRKLLQQTSPDFVDWIDTMFMNGDDLNPAVLETFYVKSDLLKQFREEFEYDAKQLSSHKFTKWMKAFASHMDIEIKDVSKRIDDKTLRGIIFRRKE